MYSFIYRISLEHIQSSKQFDLNENLLLAPIQNLLVVVCLASEKISVQYVVVFH